MPAAKRAIISISLITCTEFPSFALPSIANHVWVCQLSTEQNVVLYNEEKRMEYIDIAPRSISILVGKNPDRRRKATETKKFYAGKGGRSAV